jgi:hypothetical protein
MTSERELRDVRYHWGEAYEIKKENGWYVAARRDGRGSVRRRTLGELTAEIRADYQALPVPRG